MDWAPFKHRPLLQYLLSYIRLRMGRVSSHHSAIYTAPQEPQGIYDPVLFRRGVFNEHVLAPPFAVFL
jgi:hypothetical protein